MKHEDCGRVKHSGSFGLDRVTPDLIGSWSTLTSEVRSAVYHISLEDRLLLSSQQLKVDNTRPYYHHFLVRDHLHYYLYSLYLDLLIRVQRNYGISVYLILTSVNCSLTIDLYSQSIMEGIECLVGSKVYHRLVFFWLPVLLTYIPFCLSLCLDFSKDGRVAPRGIVVRS